MATFPVGPQSIPDPRLSASVDQSVSETLKQHAHYMRHILTATSAYLAQVQREQENAKIVDARLAEAQTGATSLYAQEGPVSLRIANRPNPGDVLYAIDTLHAAWGSLSSPAPTDPGSGPTAVSGPLLDAAHNTDTVARTPVLGDIIAANSTPKWDRVSGNTTTTRKFLRQTGTGAVSALPAWDTLVAGDIPALSSAAGWTDDGTVVRLTTSTDQVGIGTTTPGASLGIVNANNVADTVVKITGKASQSGDYLSLQNSSGYNIARISAGSGASLFLGDSFHDPNSAPFIYMGSATGAVATFTSPRSVLTWGDNAVALSAPATTADMIGCAGARFYPYKDNTGQYDVCYGQDTTDAWVLISDETITYSFYTGRHPSAPFLRAQWAGNGDLTNYGKIRSRKSISAGTKGVPGIELEETGSGTDVIAVRAPSAVGAARTQLLQDLNATFVMVGDDPPSVASRALGKVDLTAQTADIASTNLTNSAPAGFYEIQAVLEDTTADATAGVVTVTFGWTDDVGATTDATLTQTLAVTGRNKITLPIYLASGNITYATSHTGIFGTAQYAIRIRVVALG